MHWYATYMLRAHGVLCHFDVDCVDIDECKFANGGCAQVCSNTIGSFQCKCRVGYQLIGNKEDCEGEQHVSAVAIVMINVC